MDKYSNKKQFFKFLFLKKRVENEIFTKKLLKLNKFRADFYHNARVYKY